MNRWSAVLRMARESVAGLHPAYFAMVMATGIVAIACQWLGLSILTPALIWLNLSVFCILWLMTIARIVLCPVQVYSDLIDHQRGVGFLTTVAGTCVLGSQLIVVHQQYTASLALWILGIILWIGLTYALFTAYTVKQTKPALDQGINGGWLVLVVATQSVANLGVLLLPRFPGGEETVLFWALSLWLFGGMLYIWLIALIVYRYTFFRFSPSDLMPPYWINMGAMAISTLVGCNLVAHAGHSALITDLLPFVKGLTIMFWATATWWIPMLLILGFWRHVVKRFHLAYDPLYWGAVFPLGMYAACTFRLGDTAGQPALLRIARCVLYVAIAAWVAVSCGLLRALVRRTITALGRVPQGHTARDREPVAHRGVAILFGLGLVFTRLALA